METFEALKKTLLKNLQACKDTEAAGRMKENVYQRSPKLVRGTGIYKAKPKKNQQQLTKLINPKEKLRKPYKSS